MVATTSASVGLPLAAALLLLLLLLLPICNASMAKGALSEEPATATSGEKRGGIILIPGLGRVDRLQLVTHNLFYLEQYIQEPDPLHRWECVVYIYASRDQSASAADKAFWAPEQESRRKYVESLCHLVYNPGALVTENLWMAQAQFTRQLHPHVFVLLDDVELLPTAPAAASVPASAFAASSSGSSGSSTSDAAGGGSWTWDLAHLVGAMDYHRLTLASGRVTGNTFARGQEWRQIMGEALPLSASAAAASTASTVEGWLSSFVEIYACVYSAEGWEALGAILHPSTNPYAWGYDFWYPQHAAAYLSANFPATDGASSSSSGSGLVHRQAIIASLQTKHQQGEGRADDSGEKVKWAGVQAQEVWYSKYQRIPLKRYRSKFVLANNTADGAKLQTLGPVPVDWEQQRQRHDRSKQKQQQEGRGKEKGGNGRLVKKQQRKGGGSGSVRGAGGGTETADGALVAADASGRQGKGLVVIHVAPTAAAAQQAVKTLAALGFASSASEDVGGGQWWWECAVVATAEGREAEAADAALAEAMTQLRSTCLAVIEAPAAMSTAKRWRLLQPVYLAQLYSHLLLIPSGGLTLTLQSTPEHRSQTDASRRRDSSSSSSSSGSEGMLQDMLDTMSFNGLGVLAAAPAASASNSDSNNKGSIGIGKRTTQIDFRHTATMFTLPAWSYLWALLCPTESCDPAVAVTHTYYHNYVVGALKQAHFAMGVSFVLHATGTGTGSAIDVVAAQRLERYYQTNFQLRLLRAVGEGETAGAVAGTPALLQSAHTLPDGGSNRGWDWWVDSRQRSEQMHLPRLIRRTRYGVLAPALYVGKR